MGEKPTTTKALTNITNNKKKEMSKQTTTSKKRKNESPPLTKRQFIKKLQHDNPLNKDVQHPRIKSHEQRSRAYIRDAGLMSKSSSSVDDNNKKNGIDALDPKIDLHSPEVKFGKLLGGTNARKRHAAVLKLREYLKCRCDTSNLDGGLSELDLMKLWKGLWHTLYMADKVPVQDRLSKILSELIWCLAGTEEEDEYSAQCYLEMTSEDDLEDEDKEDTRRKDTYEADEEADKEFDGNEILKKQEEMDQEDFEEEEEEDDMEIKHCRGAHLAATFVATFFRTVRREWGKMDKYRIDKFYTAIRYMVSQVYQYMAKRHWNLGIIRIFNDTLYEEVLSQRPNGLRYHLIDIAMEELTRASCASSTPLPLTEATFLDCLEPFMALLSSADDTTVQERVSEGLMKAFLEQFSVVSDNALEEQDADTDKSQMILDQVHVGTVSDFIFKVASHAETEDRYRESLYDMHKVFKRRITEVGIDVDIDNCDVDDEGEEEENEEENLADEKMESITRNGDEKLDVAIKKNNEANDKVGGSKGGKEEQIPTVKEKKQGDVPPLVKESDALHKKTKPDDESGTSKEGKNTESTAHEYVTSALEESPKVKSDDKPTPDDTVKKGKRKRRKSQIHKELLSGDIMVNSEDKNERVDGNDFNDEDQLPSKEEREGKPKKKKKQKRKVHATSAMAMISEENDDAATNAHDATGIEDQGRPHQQNDSTSQKKKKKGSRKNKEGSPKKDGSPEKYGDEIITITQEQQKRHAEAVLSTPPRKSPPKKPRNGSKKKAEKRSPPSVDPHAMIDSDGVMSDVEEDATSPPTKRSPFSSDFNKRVSFGKNNRSKSYRASMKDLTHMETPSTSCRTPEKSILRLKRRQLEVVSEEKKKKEEKSEDKWKYRTRSGKRARASIGPGVISRKTSVDYF